MYHKEKPLPPTHENVHEYDDNEFLSSVRAKTREIAERMKQLENPELTN